MLGSIMSRYILHRNDLPPDLSFGDVLAMDSEFMGLNPWRDRLCLLQIYDGRPESKVHLIQFDKDRYEAPHLHRLLNDASKEKIFFFARADMRWIGRYLGIVLENVYCAKIASRIARTYTQAHNLEDVCKQLLGVRLSKEQQCTNWGDPHLTPAQLDYACNDVLYLHALKDKLNQSMERENRSAIAQGLFKCLPAVVAADLAGWNHEDLFAYEA